MMIKQNKGLVTLFAVGMALIGIAAFSDDTVDLSDARLAPCKASATDVAYEPRNYEESYVSFPVYSAQEGVAHSPTLIEHRDGSLQAIWFFGEDEAEPETGLASARFVDGSWTKPEVVLTAESETTERGLFVNTIGNPLLVRASDNEVWLFYVTPSLGGWATSRISVRKSVDDGRSWGGATLLRTSPFFNISSLVRQPAVCMENGTIALPLHFELVGHYPKLAVLSDDAEVVDLRSMFERKPIGLQPLILTGSDGMAEAFLRPSGEMADRVYRNESADGGISWTDPVATDLPNPGAPVCGLKLPDGGTLIAFNDNPEDRQDFRFAFREAGQTEWLRLDHEFSPGGNEKAYAYCSFLEDRSGRIHLIYSERKVGRIFHAHFSEDWLAEIVTESRADSQG